jgi:hypothetical protein
LEGFTVDGRVSAVTNEFEIRVGTQEPVLAVERKKNRVVQNSVDFFLLVNSALEVALHQLQLIWVVTEVRVVLTAKNRSPLMRQLSEAHVDVDPELALELGRNGRLELDRALGVSVGEQFVQASRKLQLKEREH